MSFTLTKTLLVLFVCVFLLHQLVKGDVCPLPLPEKCECGQEVHHGELLKAVRCAGLTSDLLPNLLNLPLGTEFLVVKDSDLEHVDSKQLQFISPSLRVVHLERNNIEDFDLKFFLCAHPNLERVYLSDNSLIWFTIDPKCSGKLRLISLKQNHINFLLNGTVAALGEMDHLQVDLSDNTFSCDCNLVPTIKLLQNQSQEIMKGASFVNFELYNCRDAYPEGFMGRRLVDLNPDQLKCAGDVIPREEDEEFYNYHSRVLYFMMGFIGVIAILLVVFSLYLNFPNIKSALKGWKDETPRMSNNKRYTSLNEETRA